MNDKVQVFYDISAILIFWPMMICKFRAVSDNFKEPALSIFHPPILRNGPAGRRCRLHDPRNVKNLYPCVYFSVIIATAISVTVTVLVLQSLY
jgi:hypothetical protein